MATNKKRGNRAYTADLPTRNPMNINKMFCSMFCAHNISGTLIICYTYILVDMFLFYIRKGMYMFTDKGKTRSKVFKNTDLPTKKTLQISYLMS